MGEPDFNLFTSLRWDPMLLQSAANSKLSGPRAEPSAFYMLQYHRDRMLQAARAFDWPVATSTLQGDEGLQALNSHLSESVEEYFADGKAQTPLRIKTVLTQTGVRSAELGPTPPVTMEQLFPTALSEHGRDFQPPSRTGGALVIGSTASFIKGPQDSPYVKPWRISPDKIATDPSPFTVSKTTRRNMYDDARARLCIKTMAEPAEVLLWNPDGEIMEGSLTSPYFFRDGRWVTPPVRSGGQNGTTRRWLLERGMCEEAIVKINTLRQGEDCYVSNGVRGLVWCRIDLLGES